jgi:hypothetical protein
MACDFRSRPHRNQMCCRRVCGGVPEVRVHQVDLRARGANSQ